MKSFLYWLLGDRGGRIVVGTWSWLLGQPIEKGDARTVAIGREALVDIEANVNQMTSAVAEQQAALADAINSYNTMQSDASRLEQQAEQLLKAGDESAASDVLADAEVFYAYLPQLKQQVDTAQSNFEASKANLMDMQKELKKMQTQQKVASSMQKVTAALSKANELSAPSSNSAKSTLDEAHDAVRRRSLLETAKSELNAQDSATNRKLNELSAAERLAALKAKNNPELPPSQ